MKRICFTVINDLAYDQRMQRICNSLVAAGFHITLIGRRLPGSISLRRQDYLQKRLPCRFNRGKLMYFEYNLRLLFHLLFISTDCYVAIDLDTIIPNYLASVIRKKKRVYDAHELFTELKEIITRPVILKAWRSVEKFAVPRFSFGYTVNDFISRYFKDKYGVEYQVVRNLPMFSDPCRAPAKKNPFFIYQGAVNEGRSFETLIPAMKLVDARLFIYGNGNFFNQLSELIKSHQVEEKVFLMGMVLPNELKAITPGAYAGVMLFDNQGLNQYQSLSNRFFDYIMAGIPQICVNYPQYNQINEKYRVAVMINDTKPETIASALNNLLSDPVTYNTLSGNCIIARQELNWLQEEKVLVKFYHDLFAV